MALGRLWAGRAYGTNTGNVFLKLEGNEPELTGKLHLNEPGVGLVVYSVSGSFDGNVIKLTGDPQTQMEGVVFGKLTASGKLNTRGELAGEWATDIGSAGTFQLFLHDQAQGSAANAKVPDQLHTARHHFGAVEIDRQQITAVAEEIQRDFKNAQLVVTVSAGTEQSRFLPDFKALEFSSERATLIKLFAQEPDGTGVSRVAMVEFGPQVNMVMTQGGDEAWVLGMLERLKRRLRPFERAYTTNFKKMGIGINQLLLIGAIVFLPSLETLRDRVILIGAILALIWIVNWMHNRYLPFAAIHLGKKPAGVFARMAPSVASWTIAATAALVAALVAAYLQGWLAIPSGK